MYKNIFLLHHKYTKGVDTIEATEATASVKTMKL